MHIPSPHTGARSFASALLAKARQGMDGMVWHGLVRYRDGSRLADGDARHDEGTSGR